MTRAVLLDFDGTLTDSKPGILASYAAALRALGHEPDPDVDMTYVIGPPIRDVIGHVLAHYGEDAGPERIEIAVAAYRGHYRTHGMLDSVLYDGVPALLRALRDNGRRIFLATAKRTDISKDMLGRFGLLHWFDGVYGSEEGGALDHKPELIAHILAQEGLAAGDAVMVGDRRYDITGAHANGVRALGALWGYGGREELEQAGADGLAEDAGALAEALLQDDPVRVRAAVRGDLPGALALYRAFRSYDPAFDADKAAPCWEAIEASGLMTLLVAEAAGQVVASCTLVVVPNLTWSGRPYAIIENVVTHPEHRRSGLGHRVLAAAQARAWDAGCYKVSLATGSKEDATLRFYEGAGFTRNAKTFFRDAARLAMRIMVLHPLGPGASPHLGCFYAAMRAEGAEVVQGHFAGRWLLQNLRHVDVLHLHWPSFHYHHASRVHSVYSAGLLLGMLALARVRGICVVWTVHNLMPHIPGRVPGLDLLVRHAVVAASGLFLVRGPGAEAAAVQAFPRMRGRVTQIEFGSWIGLYPDTVSREAARNELGIAEAEFAFLFIGQIRPNKNVVRLVECMAGLPPQTVLVVAGAVKADGLEEAIRAAAARCGRRVLLHFGHVENARMQVFLRACDMVVAPYTSVLTSATPTLAGAFGRPFLGPAMASLVDTVPAERGILYAAPQDLPRTLLEAVGRRFDEGVIRAHAARSDWGEAARTALAAMRRACGAPGKKRHSGE